MLARNEATDLKSKKTSEGSPMDGQGLVELARCLKDMMNSDSWLDFANAYVALGVY